MTQKANSLETAYFDALYARDADPWNFARSDYERAKYGHTLRALHRPHYQSAVEVGCSIGILTAQLAPRCTSLLALDASERPLIQARDRCKSLPQVRFERARVPENWPDGTFDLLLFSEVLYYLSLADLQDVASCVSRSAAPAAHVLLVHWTGETNYPLSGDDATERFISAIAPSIHTLREEVTDAYRLAVLELN